MKRDEKLKSKSWLEYNPDPFFFRQKYSGGFRLVAWTSKLRQLKKLVYSILDTFPENVDILLKIRDENYINKWHRYHSSANLNRLIETMKRNETFVFSDGDNQLCVKRPDTDEYITLDDHGVLFIYSESEQFVDICQRNGFTRKRRKLFYTNGHWHICPEDSESLGRKIIKELKLRPVR